MPKKGSILKFKSFFRKMRLPFVVYADFECFTEKLDTTQPNPKQSYTKQCQKHTPSGFCYYIKCFEDSVYKQERVIYTKQAEDEDVAQIFFHKLVEDLKGIYMNCGKARMTISPNQQRKFQKATKCWICGDKLVIDKGHQDHEKKQPVRDLCHFTGKYRGPAHNECNRQFRKPKFTPIFFHNLSDYDSHLFIKNLSKTQGNIKCIPNNEERYISFSKNIKVYNYTDKETRDDVYINHEMRFLDSCKFMASILDNLSSNLDKEQFTNLNSMYKGEQLELLKRKGVYPYDYVDSLDRLAELQLPPKETFYSKLNDEYILDEDYEHAQKVWEAFDCKTLKDYHDLYLESDVLLLADVFEAFRSLCMTNYELDPAWYYTAPGLAWDAALKLTKIELELLTDIEMLDMVEEGIRGGISSIMHRHGKANKQVHG